MSQIEEVVKEFLVESDEYLQQLDQDLVSLEMDPSARHLLASIFRTIHTLKGSSGFLGFRKLESLTHAGESLLTHLRDDQLVVTPQIVTALLALVDAVRTMVGLVQATGTDGDCEYGELIDMLEKLRQSSAPTVQCDSSLGVPAGPSAGVNSANVAAASEASKSEPVMAGAGGAPVAPATQGSDRSWMAGGSPPPPQLPARELPISITDTTVRIDIRVLDKLMNLVSELVLARNQILRFVSLHGDGTFQNAARHLNVLTSELQEQVMATRMQPIATIWSKFPRVVRDLALACGKKVGLEMEGGETELDKTIIEAIKDPLMHLIRNAVDHGIEQPETRLARGKRAEGRICLRAFHESGEVNIHIADDGQGIDPEYVRRRAVEQGLITPEQAATMHEHTSLNLIFLPGFSTSHRVTAISGRGVGMDVVKTNIEKIGGKVNVYSRLGEGTTIHMRIPLTLAIIRALIVTCGSERYAVPQNRILQMIRLDPEKAGSAIERIQGAPVYRYRSKLLPLVFLHQVLSGQDEVVLPEVTGEAVNIVVLQADDRRYGLVVDRIWDSQEVVVKPLAKQLRGVSCFAGATIMGDGRVALILDVLGLGQRAQVVPKVRSKEFTEAPVVAQQQPQERQTFVIAQSTEAGRLAVPLSWVARLEKFPRAAIEQVGGRVVVQYRGKILPLIDVASLIAPYGGRCERSEPFCAREEIEAIVCSDQGYSLGLVVDSILDIVEDALSVTARPHLPHISCTAVIGGRVAAVIDVQGILATAAQTWTANEPAMAVGAGQQLIPR